MKDSINNKYKDFIIFLSVDYDDFFRRHLIKALAGQLQGKARILCINRPVCPIVTTIKNPKKMVIWLESVFFKKKNVRILGRNLYLYTPFLFLHDQLADKIPFIKKANRRILILQLKLVLKKLQFNIDKPIVWIFNPYQSDYVDLFPEKYLIYDCYDEYLAAVNFRKESILIKMEQIEKNILKKTALVFAASKQIAARRKKWHNRICILPNAVDIKHFAAVRYGYAKIPAELMKIPKPIIGYVGTINERTDFQLVLYIAIHKPEWSIVFIGPYVPIFRDFFKNGLFKRAKQQHNIHFLGAKSYEVIPSYIGAFDICIIPYSNNKFNQSCSPLKMYEYLAAGKPVISTDIFQVRDYSKVVSIAYHYEEFISSVENALRENNADLAERRYRFVLGNSWDDRASEILRNIDFFTI